MYTTTNTTTAASSSKAGAPQKNSHSLTSWSSWTLSLTQVFQLTTNPHFSSLHNYSHKLTRAFVCIVWQFKDAQNSTSISFYSVLCIQYKISSILALFYLFCFFFFSFLYFLLWKFTIIVCDKHSRVMKDLS